MGLFDAEEHELELAAQNDAAARCRETWRRCWPEWHGPTVGGDIEVLMPIVHSLTHDRNRYHKSAPCIVREISADSRTFVAEVRWLDSCPPLCTRNSGELLRLDISDVWAPTKKLRALRDALDP